MERGTETGFLIFLKNKCYLLNGKVYKYKQKRVFQEAALELKSWYQYITIPLTAIW